MDTYIKYSFLIEIALIIIVLALLYIGKSQSNLSLKWPSRKSPRSKTK